MAHEIDQDPWQYFTPEKSNIYFHRSYRKLEQHSMFYILLMLFLLIGVVDFLIILFFSPVSHMICSVSKQVLSTCIPSSLIEIIPKGFVYNDVYILSLPGRYPSLTVSIITAIISLIILYFAIAKKHAIEPKQVWFVFIFFIVLVSALFFIFLSAYFPYDLEFFSEMYIKTEVGIWIAIPIILTIALLPFPIRFHRKFMVITFTLLYSVIFACVRYIVFLYLLRVLSYLFMALMFFMLGPFLDFIYIVGSYSLCLTSTAIRTNKDLTIWNWLR